jgi:hypothetical protein
MSEQAVVKDFLTHIDNRKIGGFVKFFRSAIDTDSNPDDDVAVVKSKDTSIMEDKFQTIAGSTGISNMRKDALIHDLILVVKSAMTKVNSRDQMWCDILAKTEKDIRRMVDQSIK